MNVVDTGYATASLWFALHLIQTIGLVVCQCTSDDEFTLYESNFLLVIVWALIVKSSFHGHFIIKKGKSL